MKEFNSLSISQSQLRYIIKHLSSYPTRYSTSPYYTMASTWVRNILVSWGYDTTFQPVVVEGQYTRNVIAQKGASEEIVLVVAHLDSINEELGPDGPAPGADDNVSGCAGLLEIARCLRGFSGLCFLLTGGEEQGFLGAKEYLSFTKEDRIKAVINIDQIGRRNTESLGVLLETDRESFLLEKLRKAALTHPDLEVQTSFKAWGGDHLPFLKRGIPAVLTIEAEDKKLHTSEDTEEGIDYDLVSEITHMNLEAILSLLEV